MGLGESLGELFVHLKGDNTQLVATLVKSKAEMQEFGATVKAESVGMGMSLTQLSLGIAAVAATVVGGLIAMTEDAIKTGEAFYRLRAITGMTGEELSGFAFQAKKVGVDLAGIQNMLSRLALNAQNNGKGFQTLGLSTRDASGQLKSMDTILGEVADKFQAMPDGTLKTAIAVELFGRAGARMVRVLNEGSAGLREAQQEADRLGVTLNDSTIDAMHNAAMSQHELDSAWSGLNLTIAEAFLPVLARVITGARDLIQGLRAAFTALQPLAPLFRGLVDVVALLVLRLIILKGISVAATLIGLGKGALGAIPGLVGVGAAAEGAAVGEGAATVATRTLSASLAALALPITLIIGGFVLLQQFGYEAMQGVRVLGSAALEAAKNVLQLASAIPFIGDGAKAMADEIQKQQDRLGQEEQDALAARDKAAADSAKAAQDAADGITAAFANADATVTKSAGQIMLDAAAAIRDKRTAIDSALKQLGTDLKDTMNKGAEIARLGGLLIGADLKAGLASTDPVVAAQAKATRKLITDELDVLTKGAYSAGQNAGHNLWAGLRDAMKSGDTWSEQVRTGQVVEQLANNWQDIAKKFKPAKAGAMLLNSDLSKATHDMSAYKDTVASAFEAMKTKAKAYFDAVHEANLKQIRDARDTANQQLQIVVDGLRAQEDALSGAMDKRHDARRFQGLQADLANAQASGDPGQVADAQAALLDFQDEMAMKALRAQEKAAQDAAAAQKAANDKKAAEQTAAENKRYQTQTGSFDKDLAALQKQLSKGHEAWKTANDKVLALLKSYGIKYQAAGSDLSAKFLKGLGLKLPGIVSPTPPAGGSSPVASAGGPTVPNLTNVRVPSAGGGTVAPAPVAPQPPLLLTTIVKLNGQEIARQVSTYIFNEERRHVGPARLGSSF